MNLTKRNVIQIISDFLAHEDNIKSVIELCISHMKDTVQFESGDAAILCNEHASLSAKIVDLERQHASMLRTISNLEHEVRVSNHFSELLERRIDYGYQYCRRLNLMVDGIPIKRGETPSSIRSSVMDEINRLGLNIANCEVDRAHRAEHSYYRNGVKQQPVIVRFVSWSARDKLYQVRKDSNLHFRPDMTDRRRNILQHARQEIAARAESGDPKLVEFVGMDRNCRLFMRSAAGSMYHFSTELEFDLQYLALEDSSAGRADYLHEDRGRFDVDDEFAAEADVPAPAHTA